MVLADERFQFGGCARGEHVGLASGARSPAPVPPACDLVAVAPVQAEVGERASSWLRLPERARCTRVINFDGPVPVWRQIEAILRDRIADGT